MGGKTTVETATVICDEAIRRLVEIVPSTESGVRLLLSAAAFVRSPDSLTCSKQGQFQRLAIMRVVYQGCSTRVWLQTCEQGCRHGSPHEPAAGPRPRRASRSRASRRRPQAAPPSRRCLLRVLLAPPPAPCPRPTARGAVARGAAPPRARGARRYLCWRCNWRRSGHTRYSPPTPAGTPAARRPRPPRRYLLW